jgi:hypothetical protein
MSDKTPLQTIMSLPYKVVKERIAAFKAEHPVDDGTTVEAHDWRTKQLVREYKLAQEAKSQAEETMERTRLALMERMGDAGTLLSGAFVVTFKAFDKAEVHIPAMTIRSIRVAKSGKTAKAAEAASRKVVVDNPVNAPDHA